MSATPASIDLSFVSNYAGDHRVCWRIGGSGPYTCQTVSCGGNGATCTAVIAVTVDNETCTNVDFQFYVQPVCVDITSTDKRVYGDQVFTPNPSCKRYIFTCSAVGVASITLNNPGTTYASPPAVVISGGGGSGATATANIDGSGVVTSITLNTPGSGYTSVPTVTIAPPSGGGTQATATAVLGHCSEITANGCSGTPGTIPTILNIGDNVSICKTGDVPTPPSGVTSTPSGTCACTCVNATIAVTGTVGSTIQYYYNKCNGAFVSGFLSVGGSPININDCVVSGSVLTRNISGSPTPSVTYGASCP